jgi:amino acid transporter
MQPAMSTEWPTPSPAPSPSNDDDALRALGYQQDLRRGMSAFGNFALSFSVISILTGALALYGFGLAHGGPIQMTLGWPLVSVMTLAVAASLAELASAYPTAGALYHWSSWLGGRGIGWWTAWLNLVGQIAVIAGVDFALADLVAPMLGLSERRDILILYGGVLLSHAALNHVGIRVVTLLNELSAWYHLVGTLLLVAVVLWRAKLQPVGFLFTTNVTPEADGRVFSLGYALLIGLLQAQWTLTGYDASAHASEETRGAADAAPRGIVNSVMVSGIAGWVLLIGLTLAIQDLRATVSAPNSFVDLVMRALGPTLGSVTVWVVAGAMWFCGLSSVTSSSRMLYAFARDGGVPGSSLLGAVSSRFRTPAAAVWACAATALLLAVWGRFYNVITSISTIGLYASYGIPIVLVAWGRRRGKVRTGRWTLGRWGGLVNGVALFWIGGICVVFMLPPNERTGLTFAVLLAVLAGVWFGWAHRGFRGPPPLKSEPTLVKEAS